MKSVIESNNTSINPVILMRSLGQESEQEELACQSYFKRLHLRSEVKKDDLVVCRYSALPYFDELVMDIHNIGAHIINSYAAHTYCAQFEYYYDIEDLTFESWERLDMVPRKYHQSPFVVKGKTNSRKQQWNSKMFANNFVQASSIAAELMCDGLIGQQGIVIRKFEPLETFEVGINGLPFTNEWRVFFLDEKPISWGYYWGACEQEGKISQARSGFEKEGLLCAQECAKRIHQRLPFSAIDVARTKSGRWMVVEVNDGQQAGLNGTIEAQQFYENLSKAVLEKDWSFVKQKEPEYLIQQRMKRWYGNTYNKQDTSNMMKR